MTRTAEVFLPWDHLSHEAQEIVLYVENDEPMYRRLAHTCAALARKWDRGLFDLDRAIVAMRYVTGAAAMAYHREHGSPFDTWHSVFTTGDRVRAAEWLARSFVDDLRTGDRWWEG